MPKSYNTPKIIDRGKEAGYPRYTVEDGQGATVASTKYRHEARQIHRELKEQARATQS